MILREEREQEAKRTRLILIRATIRIILGILSASLTIIMWIGAR